MLCAVIRPWVFLFRYLGWESACRVGCVLEAAKRMVSMPPTLLVLAIFSALHYVQYYFEF